MAVFGPKLQFLKLRSATCDTRSRPPPLSFWLILCVVVPHTHRYHPPKFQPNPKHHNGVLIFPHFARVPCCLLLAAAAKPGRSTLDPKKGYKTKTGSTSSVTLTLTLTPPPFTPGWTPPPPRPPAGTSPDPRLDPPPPPYSHVLKDIWGVGCIRTSCSHPPRGLHTHPAHSGMQMGSLCAFFFFQEALFVHKEPIFSGGQVKKNAKKFRSVNRGN